MRLLPDLGGKMGGRIRVILSARVREKVIIECATPEFAERSPDLGGKVGVDEDVGGFQVLGATTRGWAADKGSQRGGGKMDQGLTERDCRRAGGPRGDGELLRYLNNWGLEEAHIVQDGVL